MVKETQVTRWAFSYSLVFYAIKRWLDPVFTDNVFEIATYTLIAVTTMMVLANIYHMKILYSPLLGLVSFNTVYLGILLAGTKGLGNSEPAVVEGLSRIILALFAIWKLSSDMRHLSLQINPFREERSKIKNLFFGILYPPKELFRLLKVIFFVVTAFYLVFSGLDLLTSAQINLIFFQETERVSLNVLFFGIQTPMMMASRASISKTFSEYLQNLEWAEAITQDYSSLSQQYHAVLNSNEISYDSINSNGKHLWFTVLLMIILQAFQSEILALDLFQLDYGSIIGDIIHDISNFISNFF